MDFAGSVEDGRSIRTGMPMFVEKEPYKVVQEAFRRILARESARLGLAVPGFTGTVVMDSAPETGVLYYRRAGQGPFRPVGAVPVLRLLSKLPDGAGSPRTGLAVENAIPALRLLPHPTNSGTHLQIGDVFGRGRVDGILVGKDRDSAKDGDPVDVVDRFTFGRNPDRYVITFSEPGGGFWRRGAVVAAALPTEYRQVTERRHLRRLLAGVEALYARENAASGDGRDRADTLLDLHLARTGVTRMLELVSSPQDDPVKSERATLRMRRRDIDRTLAADEGTASFREALGRERETVAERIREVGEIIASDEDRDWKIDRAPGF